MSFVYNGAHSITFIEALDSTTDSTPTAYLSYKRSWRDFHLIPEKRPSVSPPTPTLNLIEVPGTNNRIDMTDLLPGGLKYGRRTGEWGFILDHYLWDNWHTAKKTIEDALNGKRLYCVLEDDFNTAYRGRFKVTGWQSGPDYSSISISYELEPKKYINAFSIQSDEQENKMLMSWGEVDKMIQDGSYKKNIAIHDTCHLYIPGEYNDEVEVAGVDVDSGYGDFYAGKPLPITWIAKKLLNNSYPIYDSGYYYDDDHGRYYMEASFVLSPLYQYLTFDYSEANSFVLLLPEILKKMIKRCEKNELNVLMTNHYGTSTADYNLIIENSYPKLWIPSYREVIGGTSYESSGPVYGEIFKSGIARIFYRNGIVDSWWLRTSRYPSTFHNVGTDGYVDTWRSKMNVLKGILLGFCTGASNVT